VSDAHDQIRNLIHRYAEAVDGGRFEVLDELFAHATVRVALGTGEPRAAAPGGSVASMFGDGIILYPDGTPRTRHLVTNTIIDVDEEGGGGGGGRATAHSYNTTLQQVPGRSIEIIATARYEDTFEQVDGAWRFCDRVIRHSSVDGVHRDFIGDMSRHTRNAARPDPGGYDPPKDPGGYDPPKVSTDPGLSMIFYWSESQGPTGWPRGSFRMGTRRTRSAGHNRRRP
jgi:SnoaL-like domain